MQHAGLDDAQLGPRLARLLAANSPLPAREMVARGLAPLAGAEAWLALYQLWVRGGPTLAEHASRTAGELPPAAVMTALADPHLPPVVLDFMARRRIRSPETLRLIVHHPRVHDATLAALARCAPEQVCGAIAKNQRRWLACPAIAEQLVHNPCCERATAHAVLELGARESIAGLAELRRRALAGHDVRVREPVYVAVELELFVCADPGHFRSDVRTAVQVVLRDFFHPDNFTFGTPLYLSRIYAAAQAVPGVAHVDVTALRRQGRPDTDAVDSGELRIGPREILRLDNDPNFAERGVLRIRVGGGK